MIEWTFLGPAFNGLTLKLICDLISFPSFSDRDLAYGLVKDFLPDPFLSEF